MICGIKFATGWLTGEADGSSANEEQSKLSRLKRQGCDNGFILRRVIDQMPL